MGSERVGTQTILRSSLRQLQCDTLGGMVLEDEVGVLKIMEGQDLTGEAFTQGLPDIDQGIWEGSGERPGIGVRSEGSEFLCRDDCETGTS